MTLLYMNSMRQFYATLKRSYLSLAIFCKYKRLSFIDLIDDLNDEDKCKTSI